MVSVEVLIVSLWGIFQLCECPQPPPIACGLSRRCGDARRLRHPGETFAERTLKILGQPTNHLQGDRRAELPEVTAANFTVKNQFSDSQGRARGVTDALFIRSAACTFRGRQNSITYPAGVSCRKIQALSNPGHLSYKWAATRLYRRKIACLPLVYGPTPQLTRNRRYMLDD